MLRSGLRPDDHTFPFVLKTCADHLQLQKGMEIHGCLFKFGFDFDVFVGNTLLLLYGNCRCLGDVKRAFDEMPERDIVSWNTLIGIFSVNGFFREAMELYVEMNFCSDFKPNSVSIVSVLPVCAGLADEVMARRVHCYAVKVGLDVQVAIGNALVDVYGKCGNVKASKRVFDDMVDRNEVSWNSIITSLAYAKHNKDALDMFRLMISEGLKPSCIALSSMLPVLVELQLFCLGKEIHGFSVRTGMESDMFVANSLIDMYAKFGYPVKASNVFNNMESRNVVSWNAMVANFTLNRLEVEALHVIRDMLAHNEVPNSVTMTNALPACARAGLLHPGKEIHAKSIRMGFDFDLFLSNTLTDMYAKCGCLNLAQSVFNMSVKDEVSYNILIEGYSKTSYSSESLRLFSEMKLIGMQHDVVSFMGAISACTNLAASKQGKEIHGISIKRYLHTHLFVANSLLDFYSRTGRIDLAQKIFDHIANKDAASWNTMILGYGMLGEVDTALNLFEAMRLDGIDYDSVSYIAVLSACSHAGLVERGREYFEQLHAQNVELTQMHYACMVDLLGRAGLMEEAVTLINNMTMIPDANTWGALLGACRIHGDLELASWAAEHLLKLKPQHSGYYLLLANMYAEAGKWDEAKRIREVMKSKGAKKSPACSWVQTSDQVQAFVVGEKMDNYPLGLY